MSLHETMAMCKLDGAQLEDHALLLRSHGERRDRGWWIILEDVGIRSRVRWRVLILSGGNRNSIPLFTPEPSREDVVVSGVEKVA